MFLNPSSKDAPHVNGHMEGEMKSQYDPTSKLSFGQQGAFEYKTTDLNEITIFT